MILTVSEMKSLEERVIADGISAETLMDQAGRRMARAVRQFFPQPAACVVFFGKGHNGGDALVAARHLGEAGWEVYLAAAYPEEKWSDLVKKKHQEAGRCQPHFPKDLAPRPGRPIIVLDGLLGTGSAGPLREPILRFTRTINSMRHAVDARVFAVDIPTGLDGDTGKPEADTVVADFTLTVGYAKTGLIADEAINHVGRLAVLPLPEFGATAEKKEGRGSAPRTAIPKELAPLLRRREFDSHKGAYGRIGIIAGSRGYAGAALIAASACVRAGAGLVTLYSAEDIYPVLATAAPHEVMVKPVDSYLEALEYGNDVLALGPGLGNRRAEEVLEVIRRWDRPMVVDADGLNHLAEKLDVLEACEGPRLLTPHPGEMARLDPESANRPRHETVASFTEAQPVTLLLKGARTVIGERGRPLSYNTTGNPGMASGGMGDALTGVCAALAGQGLGLYDAARVGSWVCGRAAELCLSHGGDSEESLCATRLVERLGAAFGELRSRCF